MVKASVSSLCSRPVPGISSSHGLIRSGNLSCHSKDAIMCYLNPGLHLKITHRAIRSRCSGRLNWVRDRRLIGTVIGPMVESSTRVLITTSHWILGAFYVSFVALFEPTRVQSSMTLQIWHSVCRNVPHPRDPRLFVWATGPSTERVLSHNAQPELLKSGSIHPYSNRLCAVVGWNAFEVHFSMEMMIKFRLSTIRPNPIDGHNWDCWGFCVDPV